MGNVRALSKAGPPKKAFLSPRTLARGLRLIEEHCPNLAMTEERLTIWGEMLGDLTEEQFIRGVKSFCLAHRELNRGTNIIAHIRHYALTDPRRPTGTEAWGEVLLAMRRIGSWGTPTFTDPLIAKTVESVGWLEMCRSENVDVIRGQFLKMYDALVSRETFNAVAGIGE